MAPSRWPNWHKLIKIAIKDFLEKTRKSNQVFLFSIWLQAWSMVTMVMKKPRVAIDESARKHTQKGHILKRLRLAIKTQLLSKDALMSVTKEACIVVTSPNMNKMVGTTFTSSWGCPWKIQKPLHRMISPKYMENNWYKRKIKAPKKKENKGGKNPLQEEPEYLDLDPLPPSSVRNRWRKGSERRERNKSPFFWPRERTPREREAPPALVVWYPHGWVSLDNIDHFVYGFATESCLQQGGSSSMPPIPIALLNCWSGAALLQKQSQYSTPFNLDWC